jgi:hypothetical protein
MKQIIGHPMVLLALGAVFLCYGLAFLKRFDSQAEQAAASTHLEAGHRADLCAACNAPIQSQSGSVDRADPSRSNTHDDGTD